MLSVRDIHVAYGPVLALQGVSLEVPEGAIAAVLGPNGAGKTSTLRAIAGILRPRSGVIEFAGRRIDRLPPERIVRLGIAQVPEGRQIFAGLTVLENLRLGAFSRGTHRGIAEDLERVFSCFPPLQERQHMAGGLLSGGEQQMLAIGRALMARPRLLLLDEPSLGLAPMVVRSILQTIRMISEAEGLTVLLVEQNTELALRMAQRAYVLETGRVVLSGTAEELRQNEAVRAAYLGAGSVASARR
jgi:branched-chain amino acid transport system ATP-binding protein